MSATISYKGNIITTVDNTTKTLTTEGKYLEGDIIISDITSGIIDDSVAGMDITYQGTNLTFNGTSSTFIDTGIKLLSSSAVKKNFKIVIKDLYQEYNSQSLYETMICCEYEDGGVRPGFRAGFGTGALANSSDIIYARGSYIDELVISYIDSVPYVGCANKTLGHHLDIYIPDFNHVLTNETNLVIGGATNSGGTGFRFAKGSIGSIIVAQS